MGEVELTGTVVAVGVAGLLVVPEERIQGASLLTLQYTPDSTMLPAQQSSALVPGIEPQPLPPQKSHTSRQQTVSMAFSTPTRPLEQVEFVPPIEGLVTIKQIRTQRKDGSRMSIWKLEVQHYRQYPFR